MKKNWMAVVVLALAFVCGAAQAAVLVDTGPGGTSSIGAWSLFSGGGHFQSLGGRFTLTNPATLDSVEGWMGPFGNGGPIDVKIRADGAVPGTAIYSKNYTLGTRIPAGWDVFGGFSVTLPAGTYWLCFEPVAGGGVNYSMPPGASSPLPSYAYLADGNPGWIVGNPNPTLGMRVSGGPVVASPQGTGVRQIFEAPDGDADTIEGGDGQVESYYGHISLNGYGWAFARGALFANGLTAGAAAVSSQSNAAARSVAWRTFQNTTGATKTFRVNATLKGEFDPNGNTFVQATGAVNALDSQMFAIAVAASGKTTERFLLEGNALSAITGAQGLLNLASLFPAAARLGSDVEVVNFQNGIVSIPLQTGLITVAPNATFTLLYDVSALSRGAGFGGTLFNDTLEPAPVPFTDAGGSPVTGIVPLGPSVTVGEANFLSWDDSESVVWHPALGATLYRFYRGTKADLPKLLDANIDSCLLDEGVDTSSYTPVEIPPPGQFFWYLAVGVNGSTVGSAGDATSGARVLNSSGDCP